MKNLRKPKNLKNLVGCLIVSFIPVSANAKILQIINGQPIEDPGILAEPVILSLSNNVFGAYESWAHQREGIKIGACHKGGSHKTVKQKCIVVGVNRNVRIYENDKQTKDYPAYNGGLQCLQHEYFMLKGPRVFLSSTNGGSVAPADMRDKNYPLKKECDFQYVGYTLYNTWGDNGEMRN